MACPSATVAGASPLFPPQHPTVESATTEVQHLAQRDARTCGSPTTRWTLTSFQQACPWLHGLSLPGVHQILDRLGVVWKRARMAVRSPDPHYDAKRADIAALIAKVAAAPERFLLTYLDEITIERQPSVVDAYALRGDAQAKAQRSHTRNTLTRLIATLAHHDARVVFRRASHIRLETLVGFYCDVCAAYPQMECIYVVQDNWPVHTHPDVLVALQPQQTRWEFHRPGNWPTEASSEATRKWGQLQLPIQIVPLPTYASWCNPIEKLWRMLRQEVTHLHPWADDLEQLRTAIDTFLAQFANGSDRLLRYVGLTDTRLIC